MNTKLALQLAILATIFHTAIQPVHAQAPFIPPHIDPLIYPPLTERDGKDLNIPLPPAEHPRLYFRKIDLPALHAKVSSPRLAPSWQKILAHAAFATDGKLPVTRHNPDPRVNDAIEARAFLYALNNDRAAGTGAITALFNYDDTLIIDMKSPPDVCRDIGRAILTNAIIYDWCYDLLTPAQRAALISKMEFLGSQLEIKWPALVQGSVVGHGTEAQLAREMLACGIATFDEKPEIYHLAAGRIFAEFLPARRFFYPAGYHHQGSSYGPYRFLHDISLNILFAGMGHPDVLGDDMFKIPYRWIYTRRPDNQLLRDGDDFSELFSPPGRYWSISGCAQVASAAHDPVLMGEAVRSNQIGKDPLFDFITIDPSLPAQEDLSSLPLSHYFPPPLGAMVARTSWDTGPAANTVLAEMKIGTYNFTNHQHLDAGSFQIYYKGPLATTSGIYQGTNGGYASEHFLNYYQRSIAHNTLLINDPNEKFFFGGRQIANDSGQQYPHNGDEPRNLPDFLAGNYQTGELLSQSIGPDPQHPDYTYIKGEIARAYGPKAKSVQRSFVFLNLDNTTSPAALIVLDRIEAAQADFKKTWLLHSSVEPAIQGNLTTITNHGQLRTTTLLPAKDNLAISKVGGPGHEYTVAGQNYPQHAATSRPSTDNALWRLEITPVSPALVDHFLNVLQITDPASPNPPATPELFDTPELTGARLAGHVVLFSKSGARLSAPLKLTISPDGPVKVLITDLQDGPWKISARSTTNPPRPCQPSQLTRACST